MVYPALSNFPNTELFHVFLRSLSGFATATVVEADIAAFFCKTYGNGLPNAGTPTGD
jgi:hypothetical protein